MEPNKTPFAIVSASDDPFVDKKDLSKHPLFAQVPANSYASNNELDKQDAPKLSLEPSDTNLFTEAQKQAFSHPSPVSDTPSYEVGLPQKDTGSDKNSQFSQEDFGELNDGSAGHGQGSLLEDDSWISAQKTIGGFGYFFGGGLDGSLGQGGGVSNSSHATITPNNSNYSSQLQTTGFSNSDYGSESMQDSHNSIQSQKESFDNSSYSTQTLQGTLFSRYFSALQAQSHTGSLENNQPSFGLHQYYNENNNTQATNTQLSYEHLQNINNQPSFRQFNQSANNQNTYSQTSNSQSSPNPYFDTASQHQTATTQLAPSPQAGSRKIHIWENGQWTAAFRFGEEIAEEEVKRQGYEFRGQRVWTFEDGVWVEWERGDR